MDQVDRLSINGLPLESKTLAQAREELLGEIRIAAAIRVSLYVSRCLLQLHFPPTPLPLLSLHRLPVSQAATETEGLQGSGESPPRRSREGEAGGAKVDSLVRSPLKLLHGSTALTWENGGGPKRSTSSPKRMK